MATTIEAVLGAVAAGATAEATGVTDVTSLGDGDGSGDSGGVAGGVSVDLSGLAGLAGSVSRPSSAPDLSALAEAVGGGGETVIDIPTPSAGDALPDGAGIPSGGVAGLPSQGADVGTGVREAVAGSATASAPGTGIVGSIAGFDASDAGTRFGEGFSDFAANTSRGIGEGIGSAPGSLVGGVVGGAIQSGRSTGDAIRQGLAGLTGIESRDTGINDDRPGIGVTDIGAAGVDAVSDVAPAIGGPIAPTGSIPGGTASAATEVPTTTERTRTVTSPSASDTSGGDPADGQTADAGGGAGSIIGSIPGRRRRRQTEREKNTQTTRNLTGRIR